MASSLADDRHIPLDRFHVGVRLATLLWWVVSTGLLYFGGLALWGAVFGDSQSWFWLPWIVVVLLLSQPLGRWVEGELVRRWPSGRALALSAGRLIVRERAVEHPFDLSKKVNYWRWQFVIRERRAGWVPAGHLCCAIRLVQDDGAAAGPATTSLYAFLPPAEAKALGERFPMYELKPAADARAAGGREAAFMAAERTRWEGGAELEPAELTAVLEHLGRYLPEFSGVQS